MSSGYRPPPPPPASKSNKIYSTIGGIIAVIIVIALTIAFIRCLFKDCYTATVKMIFRLLSPPKKPVQAGAYAKKAADNREPPFTVNEESQFNAETMENFLNGIESQKPIRLSPDQVVAYTNNFSTKLGSGGFGEVFKGALPNRMQVAVKVLKGRWSKRIEEQFMAEVGAISGTHHVNLVKFYGFCFDRKMRALVYEYVQNGSLDKFLFLRTSTIEWEKLHDIAIGTAKGIAYLHEDCQPTIIHYDIKPANVLVAVDFTAKVADFGLAKLCNKDKNHVTGTGFRGTLGYGAPELCNHQLQINHKCDVYSFGMMLFEILGRRKNRDLKKHASQQWFPGWVWKMFEEGKLTKIMVDCRIEERNEEKAKRMVLAALWCTQPSPELRPSMRTVVMILEGVADIGRPNNPFCL